MAGLYLHIAMGFSGEQVQLAHVRLGTRKQQWPEFELPCTPRRGDGC
jgi:hypothetical protein